MSTVPQEVLKDGTSWVVNRTGVLSFPYGCVPRAESHRHMASAQHGAPTHPNSQVIVGALEVTVTFREASRLPASAGCGGRPWCPLWGHVLVLRAGGPILGAAGAGRVAEAGGGGSHGGQRGHLRPLHPGALGLPVLVRGGPGTGRGASRGLGGWRRWLPGLQLLACPLLPLQERLHHRLQLHGPAGRAAPGTRAGRRRGRPLGGGGPAALQCGGRGGAGAVQGGGGQGRGPPGSGSGLAGHASGRQATPPSHTGHWGVAVGGWLIHVSAETWG